MRLVPIEDRGGAAADRGHDPAPIGVHFAALTPLPLDVKHEVIGGHVMVDDGGAGGVSDFAARDSYRVWSDWRVGGVSLSAGVGARAGLAAAGACVSGADSL